MGKFFYKHFGDDVPLYIEREYNRLLIQEHNQEIKEQKNRVQTLNFDEVTEFFPDPSTIPVSEHELEKHRLDADRLAEYPDIVGADQLCEMLGLKYKTVCKLVREGKIPRMPDGRKIRVAKVEVINYVLQRAQFKP